MSRDLFARGERWPLSRPFRIARGVKTAADVVVVEARDGDHAGMGESVPYARYGESIESVLAQIASVANAFAAGMTRAELQAKLPPGAARNAIDCALWDLDAQQTGRSVAELAGIAAVSEVITAVTVSLDDPERMGEAAAAIAAAPLIKVKVNAEAPLAAIEAVRAAAPKARLIVDPNESWSPDLLIALLPRLAALDIALIEQPIATDLDAALEGANSPVPICADESAHTAGDLDRVARRYQAINIKLDKTGGLTEALAMRSRAHEMGLTLMIGCMVATSLSIVPALLLTEGVAFVDLDGPWWLTQDRTNGVLFKDGRMHAPSDGWGQVRTQV